MLSHGFRSCAGSTCLVLWVVVAAVWLFPHLDLPLRAIAPVRIGCGDLSHHRRWCSRIAVVPCRAPVLGVSWCAEAALLTGLLDITGGPFNPFIVMYVTYVWLAAVTLSPRRGRLVVASCRSRGFGWLVIDHVQAELAEHHRLNDFPTHLFTMWMAGAAIAELVAHYVARARGGARSAPAAARRGARTRAAQRTSRVADDPGGGRGPRTVHTACHDRRCRTRTGTQRGSPVHAARRRW